MDETKVLIKEYLKEIPSDLKQVIKNLIDNPNLLSEISDRNNVSPEKTDGLEKEILLILLTVEPVGNLGANLVRNLELTYDQALKLALDINTNVFGPIIGSLKKAELEMRDDQEGVVKNPEISPIEPEENRFIPNLNKERPRESISAQVEPDHMIPDHAAMEKTEGVHVHSQTVMPSNVSAAYTEPKKDASVGSIVDQKLRQVVRSTEEKPISRPPSNLPTRDTDPYKGNDPYREPIN